MSMMHRPAAAAAILLSLLVASTGSARITGGGAKKADCYAEFDGLTLSGNLQGKQRVDCHDGDPSCDSDGVADGTCTFSPKVCLAQTDLPTCKAPAVSSLTTRRNTANLVTIPLDATNCAPRSSVPVKVNILKNGKKKPAQVKVTFIEQNASGKPRQDVNTFFLRCLPCVSNCGTTTSTILRPTTSTTVRTTTSTTIGPTTSTTVRTTTSTTIGTTTSTTIPARFVDNGDKTVTENQTGLQWEMKDTTCPGIHCVNDLYTWSSTGTAPDGTAFTSFLTALNGGATGVGNCVSSDGSTQSGGFAGHCDWRLPTIGELQTIIDEGAADCGLGPCIDPVFGPTTDSVYWSASTDADHSNSAWLVHFGGFYVETATKTTSGGSVRAVRIASFPPATTTTTTTLPQPCQDDESCGLPGSGCVCVPHHCPGGAKVEGACGRLGAPSLTNCSTDADCEAGRFCAGRGVCPVPANGGACWSPCFSPFRSSP